MKQGASPTGRFLEKFSWFTRILIVVLFSLIGAMVLFYGLLFPSQKNTAQYYTLLLVLGGTTALFLIALFWGRFAETRLSLRARENKALPWLGLGVLLLIGFTIRLVWVMRYPVNPEGDYYTIYHAAECLAAEFDISGLEEYLPRYMALFPHIFGYASFLSGIFAVFGASPTVAAVTNVVLSTISLGLLYFIGWKLSGHVLGFLAGAIWCFYPSQILFNLQVLPDPYYTTLLLGSIALLLVIWDKRSSWTWWKLVLGGAAVGILLSLVNSARPVAAIVIIALVVVLFVIQPIAKHVGGGKKALLVVALCAMYLVGNSVNSWIFTQRVGEAPASTPGFNLLVGFNPESFGKWNEKDRDFLVEWDSKEGLSAVEVQEAMMDAAWERITSGEVDFPKLFYHKLVTLWDGDTAAVGYAGSELPHIWLYCAASNGYYDFLWLLAIGGVWLLLRQKQTLWFLFPLYVVGLTMAHLLAEVAQRYHYSGNFCLTLLAAYCIYRVGRWSCAQWRSRPRKEVSHG